MTYDDPLFPALEGALERQYGLPPGIMSAIRMGGEWGNGKSNKSNSTAVSPKGATGIYQIMGPTWKKFAPAGTSPTDPEASAMAAAAYLSYANKRYKGNLGAIAAEYNGGPKAANQFLATGDPGNNETRGYVKRVLGNMSGGAGRGRILPPSPTPPPTFQPAHLPVPISANESGASPFGDAEYSASSADIQGGADIMGRLARAPLDNGLNDSTALLADDMLDNKIGAVVDEVLGA